jgi:hypothetical protein
MSLKSKYQVIRTLPSLKQLVGEYENIQRAKFIMQKAIKHNNSGKYSIQSRTVKIGDVS